MPKSVKTKKYTGKYFPEYEIRRREYGFNRNIGWENGFKFSLYSSLNSCRTLEQPQIKNSPKEFVDHGGIFNFAFSPDGRQLAAACENKCVMFYDPYSRRQTHCIQKAHNGCVNCVKFLDTRLFATCSDDRTVALWDVRQMNKKIRQLSGHFNWVKNIEYSSGDSLLLSSGFDGRILGWDINQYSEVGTNCTVLFSMKGLMRVRLTPDASKLIICTTDGYIMLIHDLDLQHLASDMKGFQPNVYRMMQLTRTPFAKHVHMHKFFTRKRNRVEFITDFPDGNEAEVIHSLQVHPQAWCVLSRNTSSDNSSEWTCVHDIQELGDRHEAIDSLFFTDRNMNDAPSGSSAAERNNSDQDSELSVPRRRRSRISLATPRVEIPRLEVTLNNDSLEGYESDGNDNNSQRTPIANAPITWNSEFEGVDNGTQLRVTSLGIVEALQHIGQLRRRSRAIDSDSEQSTSGESNPTSGESNSTSGFSVRSRRPTGQHENLNVPSSREPPPYAVVLQDRNRSFRAISIMLRPQSMRGSDKCDDIAMNYARLTNYREEPNKGRGFIKELCFSADGRLICSPYERGVRLLMFDNKCSELSHCVQEKPQQLYAVSTNICHDKYVVSTQFSPTDFLLVSGCLDGEIVWHQPYL